MEGDGTLQMFKDIIDGLYNMMRSVEFHVFDVDFTLWGVFLWSLVGGFVVWFINKFFEH